MLATMILSSLILALGLTSAIHAAPSADRRSQHAASAGEGEYTAQDALSALNLPDNAFGATVYALLYGYPLPSYTKTFHNKLGLQGLGTNGFFAFPGLSDPSTTSVVRPNVDTVYGVSILDLSRADVVVTVPPMQADRYYLFAFYDPYGDNYASLGSLHRNAPGKYLLRPALRTGKAGLSAERCKGYAGCIDAPTLNGLMLVRVEARNTKKDLRYVNRYTGKIKVRTVHRHAATAAPLRPKDLNGLSKEHTLRALQLTARLGARNPPQSRKLAKVLPCILRKAGIRNGAYHPPPRVNLTRVRRVFDDRLRKFVASPRNDVPLGHGWSYLSRRFSGSFENGTDIVARSFVARFAYLQNTPDQAIYPTPARETYVLRRGEAYVLTFAGKPPVDGRVGFWSLTIYDSKGFLIRNKQKVYALGDRSSLRYPDGSKVYGRGGEGKRDRPFEILVQSAGVAPPSNWTDNWLPSPQDGEEFQLTLRVYAPKAAATNGSYGYPVFRKQKVITRG